MNALTMLKAMSRLDPQDIADAWDGKDAVPDAEAFLAEPEPRIRHVKHPLRRAAECAAAAACIALGVTAVLKFRALTNRIPLNSSPDSTDAVTLVTTETTGSRPVSGIQTTAPQTETTAETTGTTGTASAETVSQTADTTADPSAGSSISSETAAETTSAQSTAPLKTQDPVPVLAAMGDSAGQLTKNGTVCSADDCVWSITKDKAAIEAYLAGSEPEVILGTGNKPAGTVSAIRSDPAMIRVRWQSDDNRWESYGISSAVIENGVLKLGVSVYCADADGDYDRSPWIYEAGLLCDANAVPDLRDVQITVTKFTDSEESGIREWMRYNDTLDPDIYLTYIKEEGQS